MIEVRIDSGSHNNIKLDIRGYSPDLVADSYWIEHYLDKEGINLKDFIYTNLTEFLEHLKSMEIGKTAHYPFSISDQSSAFITAKKLNEVKLNLFMSYSTELSAGDVAINFDPNFTIDNDESIVIIGGQVVDINSLEIAILDNRTRDIS